MAPGAAFVTPGVELLAANNPGECRLFEFEHNWERTQMEAVYGRSLQGKESIADWILDDPTITANMEECIEYVYHANIGENGLFEHQSEHVIFRIVAPTATIRLSHGRL